MGPLTDFCEHGN